MIRSILTVIFGISLISATSAGAQDSSASQANNPLAKIKSLNLQNQYYGELTGIDRDANQVYLRYAAPVHAFGGDWVMRATLPINTVPTRPDLNDTTGLGDLNLFAAYLLKTDNPAVSFGFGPQISIPTASKDETGSGKWSAGFANVLFNASNPKYQWGYLLTWQASFAGDDDRENVNAGAFQPFFFYQLGQGWYLRTASVWTYNFENDNYTIPVSLGAGKVIKTDKAVVNMFVEPQYYVKHKGDGVPKWGVFGGVNLQF